MSTHLKSSKGVPQPAPELTVKMNEWKEKVKNTALKCINETMAQKCLALTDRLANDPALTREASSVARSIDPKAIKGKEKEKEKEEDKASQGKGKKRKLDNNGSAKADEVSADDMTFPVNFTVLALMNDLKKESLEFIDTIHAIRIFIQLNVPKIEDGNNFGVGVQEEVMNELSRAEDSALGIVETSTKYFISRGKLISKVLKYPQIEDYAKSIGLLDEKNYLDVRLAFQDLRNNYAILDDIVQKNLDKLMKPRSSHTSNMF